MVERTEQIPIDKIETWDNSRIRIEKISLEPLMTDIKQKGLIQYIKVWKDPDKERYILIVGNRRLESCRLLGWKTIPAIIVEKESLDFQNFITQNLSENLYREGLTPLEIARVCGLLREQGRSYGEISIMTGIPKNRIQDSMTMLKKVPEEFKEHIKYLPHPTTKRKGFIPVKVASAITSASYGRKPEQTAELFKLAKKNELTAQDIELLKILLSKGMSMKKAMETMDNIKVVAVKILFNKDELRKYHLEKTKYNFSLLISKFLTGVLKPNKKLLVDILEQKD